MTEEELKRIIDTIHIVLGNLLKSMLMGKINKLTKLVEDNTSKLNSHLQDENCGQ